MKKLLYILIAATLCFAACQREEINHPSEAGIPNAAGLSPVITVDEETNQVTFSLDNASGMVPVWNFQDKNGEWTVWQAQQGFKKIYAAAGTYDVRMYVLNANGISPDYVTGSFTVANTLVDFTRYYTLLGKGPWHINGEVEAHMGCGPSADSPVEWWSAPVNDKAAFGVYDNQISFSADGEYTFDPGAAGTVYVNIGVTQSPYVDAKGDADADYCAPASLQTTSYKFEVSGEDIYVVFEKGAYFPYIPNDAYINDPRLLIKEISAKSITLISVSADICWQYILTNTSGGGGGGTSEDPLYGNGSKSWVMAKDLPGHMGCGSSDSNPTEWWSAPANDKEGMGVYDNVLTFSKDGTYEFDPGEDGLIYVNWGCTTVDGQSHSEPDFTYAWEKQSGKYSYDGINITLPANFTVGYIPNDACYANPVFKVTELTDDKLVLVSVTPDICWQFIFVPKDGSSGGGDTPVDPSQPSEYDYNNAANLWKPVDAAGPEVSFYYAPNWNPIADPAMSQDGSKYSLSLTEATFQQWQAQVFLVPKTAVSLSAATAYDFSCVINSSTDIANVTVKLHRFDENGSDADNAAFLFTENTSLTAYEDHIVDLSNLPGVDAGNIRIVLDFGGNPANTEITVRNITLKDHSVDDGTHSGSGGGDTPGGGSDALDYDDADNMWKAVDSASPEISFYYAPNWSQIADPAMNQDGSKYSFSLAEATFQQWQAQLFMVPKTAVSLAAAKSYDFACTITSSTDIGNVTVKLHRFDENGSDADNATFLFSENISLAAYEDYTLSLSGKAGIDAGNIRIVMDFGGNPANTEISIKEIVLREHK